MRRSTVDILASYVDALRPIIYIKHFDFQVIDQAIQKVGQNIKYAEYNNALGMVDFRTKSPMCEYNLEQFLRKTMDDGFEQETFLILKDVHEELRNAKIIALLRRIAENNLYNENYHATVFILSEITVIPRELENFITVFDIPLPTADEILNIISCFIKDMNIIVEQDTINDIALSFKGLNEFQIKQILNLAYQDGGRIDKEDRELILKEKEQFIKKSGMLESVNFKESGAEDEHELRYLAQHPEKLENAISKFEALEELGGYEDSAQCLEALKYVKAQTFIINRQYEEAISILEGITDYDEEIAEWITILQNNLDMQVDNIDEWEESQMQSEEEYWDDDLGIGDNSYNWDDDSDIGDVDSYMWSDNQTEDIGDYMWDNDADMDDTSDIGDIGDYMWEGAEDSYDEW